MKRVGAFFKRNDELSSTVNLHYKGETTFGTVLGGCVSVCVNFFFLVFILL